MIKVTKQGFKRYEWEKQQEVEKSFNTFNALHQSVEIDVDVILGDVFSFVAEDPILRNFISNYSSCNVDAFYAEWINRTTSVYEPAGEMDYCFIRPIFTIENKKNGKYNSEVGKTYDFCGYNSKNPEESYSLSFDPISNIGHLPIKLGKGIVHTSNWEGKKLIDSSIIKNYDTNITFLEFLDAIFYDISFYGDPKDRDKVKDDLTESLKNIDLEKESYVDFSEFLDSLEKEISDESSKTDN